MCYEVGDKLRYFISTLILINRKLALQARNYAIDRLGSIKHPPDYSPHLVQSEILLFLLVKQEDLISH
jgi:hypothetical protein